MREGRRLPGRSSAARRRLDRSRDVLLRLEPRAFLHGKYQGGVVLPFESRFKSPLVEFVYALGGRELDARLPPGRESQVEIFGDVVQAVAGVVVVAGGQRG